MDKGQPKLTSGPPLTGDSQYGGARHRKGKSVPPAPRAGGPNVAAALNNSNYEEDSRLLINGSVLTSGNPQQKETIEFLAEEEDFD